MGRTKIQEVISHLESWAPRAYQESYDNAGLITGDSSDDVTGILVTLDCLETVVDEAIQQRCNLIIAHHPIVFKGLKKFTGSNYVERTIIKAIKNNIAIYAIHTNLDNILTGVNQKIAEKIGLKNEKILAPKTDSLTKLTTFAPSKNAEEVLKALYEAGAGQIGQYKNCSFQVEGTGTFLPGDNANPTIGEKGKQEFVQETRIEVIFPSHRKTQVMAALRGSHPYEEIAYFLSALINDNQDVGSGLVGDLAEALEPIAFLERLKLSMDLKVIRHTHLLDKPIKKAAVCGGAGSFLLSHAIRSGADIFISADFKYHEFFDADNKIIIADIGHYESEVYTKDLLRDVLIKKFPTFAINFSKVITNPISYL